MSEIAGRKNFFLLVLAVLTAAMLPSFCTGFCMHRAPASHSELYDSEHIKSAGYQIADKGCTLYVDLDNCNMIVFIDGKPFKAYPVSGGTRESPSPVGTWKINQIASWGEGFGGSWMGLNVPWGKYGIHGTVAPWLVGEYNASHGCIRMRDEDVTEVRKLVTYGTIVHIKHDTMPFRAMKSGMVGSDIQYTQKMLKSLGFYYGSADGVYGTGMETAVKKFQKANQIKEDGIIGRRTYETIRTKHKEKATRSTVKVLCFC